MKCKVTKKQEGGEEVQWNPIQTERGEFISHINGDVTPVKAKKLHKNMDDEEVTDVLPEGSYVFSRDKKMIIDPKKKFKGMDLDFTLGYGKAYYSEEKPDTSVPKEIKFTDIMNKKFTPADYAKALTNKFPVSDREFDAFSAVSNSENKASRIPYLEVLKVISEEKKPKSLELMKYGGYSKYQYGAEIMGQVAGMIPQLPYQQDALSSIPVPQSESELNADYLIHRKQQVNKPISEKGDPYEYILEGNTWKTRKKGQSTWKNLNTAGIVEVEKRLSSGRYDNYKYKSSPATKRKMEDPISSSPKTSSNTPQQNFDHWNNLEQYSNPIQQPLSSRQSSGLNFQVTDQNMSGNGDPGPMMGIDVGLMGLTSGIPYGKAMSHIATKLGPKLMPTYMQAMASGNLELASNILASSTNKTTAPILNKAITSTTNYERFFNPNYGLHNYVPRGYAYGGEVPKYQLEGLVGAAAGALADVPFKLFNVFQSIGDRRRAKKDYKQTLREIQALKGYNTNSLNNSANMGYASTLGNYLTQDPSYNYLNLTDPIQRTNSTYQDVLNNIDADKANSMNMVNQGTNTFYRNAGNLGLSPNQAGNYATSMHANALNNASNQSLKLNDSYRQALLNRSQTLNGYDEALAKDQQYGKNLVRSNHNRLNSGLFQGMNSSYQGREQGLRDLENQTLAATMGARNQQANFLTNNSYMQSHMFSQLGDALKPLANAAFQQKPLLPNQTNLQPGMSNYVPGNSNWSGPGYGYQVPGTNDYSNGYYGPYSNDYYGPTI